MSTVDSDTVVAEPDVDWPITSCYIDAWILVLDAWGLEPFAGLGVTVSQDYEGDQFTFVKYLHDDLERLYGVIAGELSVLTALEQQVAGQVRLGRVVLSEADGFYLPDTRATSYRAQHTKTTIGVDSIDLAAGRLTYFHNIGHYELSGEDYAGVFRKLPGQALVGDALPPYVEFTKRRWTPLSGAALTEEAVRLLRHHLRRRPEQNPVSAYRREFPRQMDWLMASPQAFHDYAFGNFRQFGSNFQLLAGHLDWLRRRGIDVPRQLSDTARHVSATVKALQFKVARIANRGRFDPCDATFDVLERDYETIVDGLDRAFA